MPNCDLCKGSFPTEQLVPISGKTVCAKCKPELVMNLKSGVSASPRIDPRTAQEIKRRISRLNILSFAFAIPGILLQVVAGGARGAAQGQHASEGGALALQGLGSILIIVGLALYARMKGRSGALGLLGLLSCIGLIILNYLPKNCHHCRASASYRDKQCSACGAPV
jgi:hypothetical protein